MSGLKFVTGERGNSLLLHSGYKFYKFRTSSNFDTWRCASRPCTVTVRVEAELVVRENGTHDHGPCDLKKLNRQRVSAVCKRKASDEICERPSKIIRSVSLECIGIYS